MRDLPPLPSVVSPDRITPTQASMAAKCLLRFLLGKRTDGRADLPSNSPLKYVGQAFHSLIESARRGAAGTPPSRERLRELWRSALFAAEVEAVRGGDQDWVPLTRHVKNLERTRLRAIGIAAAQEVRGPTGTGLGRTEVWLESKDKTVAGRVDAIDRVGPHVILRDYKSGVVLKPSGEPKREYEIQMLLYARLFHDVEGVWPDCLELVDRHGHGWTVAFAPDLANDEFERAREVLLRAQAVISMHDDLANADVSGIASGDEETCATCLHRPCCPVHLERLAEAGCLGLGRDRFAPLDVFGTVSEVQTGRDGRIRFRLVCRDRHVVVGSLTATGNFRDPPDLDSLTPALSLGDVVAVFGAAPLRAHDTMTEVVQLVAAPGTRAFKAGS